MFWKCISSNNNCFRILTGKVETDVYSLMVGDKISGHLTVEGSDGRQSGRSQNISKVKSPFQSARKRVPIFTNQQTKPFRIYLTDTNKLIF